MHHHLTTAGYNAKLNKFVGLLAADVAKLHGFADDAIIKKPVADVEGKVPFHLCSTAAIVASVATFHNQTQPSVKEIRRHWLDALCKLCIEGLGAVGGDVAEISKVDVMDGLAVSIVPRTGRLLGSSFD